jgi:hypothetical protein
MRSIFSNCQLYLLPPQLIPRPACLCLRRLQQLSRTRTRTQSLRLPKHPQQLTMSRVSRGPGRYYTRARRLPTQLYRLQCSALSPAHAVPTQCPPEAVVSARLIHPVQYSSPLTMTTHATYSADFNAVLDATMQHAMSLPGLSALWSMHPHQHSPFPSCTFGSFVTFDRESSTRLERGAALYSV